MNTDKVVYRGEIYYTDLDQGLGSEQMGFRPALVLQNDMGNRYSTTVIIAPITTYSERKTSLPTHFILDAEAGLTVPSIVLLEQIRTISKDQLLNYVGRLKNARMRELTHPLAISVGIIQPVQKQMIMSLCKVCRKQSRVPLEYNLIPYGDKQVRETCMHCNRRMGRLFEVIPKE